MFAAGPNTCLVVVPTNLCKFIILGEVFTLPNNGLLFALIVAVKGNEDEVFGEGFINDDEIFGEGFTPMTFPFLS